MSRPGATGATDALLYFDHAASAPRRREAYRGDGAVRDGRRRQPDRARTARLEPHGVALDDAREEIAALTGHCPAASCSRAAAPSRATSRSSAWRRTGRAEVGPRSSRSRRSSTMPFLTPATASGVDCSPTPTDVAHLPVTPDARVDLEPVQEPRRGRGPRLGHDGEQRGGHGPAARRARRRSRARWRPQRCAHRRDRRSAVARPRRRRARSSTSSRSARTSSVAPLASVRCASGARSRSRRSSLAAVRSAADARARPTSRPPSASPVALRLAVAERDAAAWRSTSARRDQLCEARHEPGSRASGPRCAGVPSCPARATCSIDGVASEELVFLCDEAGLCVSAASSCSSGAARLEPRPRGDGCRGGADARGPPAEPGTRPPTTRWSVRRRSSSPRCAACAADRRGDGAQSALLMPAVTVPERTPVEPRPVTAGREVAATRAQTPRATSTEACRGHTW